MQCEIVAKFFDLLSTITAQQRLPVEYAQGQVLYYAEIELLKQIYENPEANVSDLSRMSCVTKSAITQMSAKLMEKKLIEKYTTATNKKEKYFRLTANGEVTRSTYEEYHSAASIEMRAYLCSLMGGEKQTIIDFMEKMKKCVPVYAFPCDCSMENGACAAAK